MFRRSIIAGAGALLLLAPALLLAQVPDTARATDTVPQKDIIDVLFRRRPAKPELYVGQHFQATILPSVSYNPAFGVIFSAGGSGVVRLGDPATTSLTTFTANASYTTKGQFLVTVRSNVFLPDNNWFLAGDWRYWNTKQPTYGLGQLKDPAERSDMDFKLLRVSETAYKELEPHLFIGVGYHLDSWFDIVDVDAVPTDTTPYAEWTGTSPSAELASGYSFNFLYDSRDNALNATRGYFLHASLHNNPAWLGSDQTWTSVMFEARAYPRLGPTTTLGFWAFGVLTGGHPPYLSLPALGWDVNGRSGRGYSAGRIRGVAGSYIETELRQTFTRNGLLGGVAFVNFNSAASSSDESMYGAALGYGGGLRVKLNKAAGTNLAFDYGFGAQGSSGLFITINETF